jgi:hypothetical protein
VKCDPHRGFLSGWHAHGFAWTCKRAAKGWNVTEDGLNHLERKVGLARDLRRVRSAWPAAQRGLTVSAIGTYD